MYRLAFFDHDDKAGEVEFNADESGKVLLTLEKEADSDRAEIWRNEQLLCTLHRSGHGNWSSTI